ncbi:MAG: DmsE family decaheme c-type cytochrome [Proteobacteria bacterium]|nr:DmsE family decaheme c-type cytochrome [Pseudomonadota bacterium]MBU1648435.1 DmsE family decaheme c-type cytochrome [Pseudomonadota bacterium]MBU1985752.1 DmsE family decaheme c-type cytochrome [Pseudomonadota bacterium]
MVNETVRRRHSLTYFVVFSIAMALIASGCNTLKGSKAIRPIKEYENMIIGRFDADYVGTANCLSACHEHDRLKQDFDASTMGAQLKQESGLPLVDCESCHGPGSIAIQGLTAEVVKQNSQKGMKTKCDANALINLKLLPAPAQSLICLKCHTANATFNLHNWSASTHSINDVSCFNCHHVHGSPDLKVKPIKTGRMCFECHKATQVEFVLPSHHPLNEGRIFCTDCHDAHGGSANKLLRKETIKETCTQCHPEKRGPFSYEHADVMEDCLTCHSPHGTVNNNLLVAREPFLCLQCHEGHRITSRTGGNTSAESRRAFYSRCTDCHSRIHGTDLPSASGKGRFTQ